MRFWLTWFWFTISPCQTRRAAHAIGQISLQNQIMKPIDYLHLQMELEGIRVSGGNLITRAHPAVEDFPLVLVADFNSGEKVVYFDDTIPRVVYDRLEVSNLQVSEIALAAKEFSSCGINTEVGSFKTYIFPENYTDVEVELVKCFQQDDPKVIDFGFNSLAEQVFAIEQDGKIISACVSSRQNKQSAESWVRTDPEHRGKGLAQQVVSAWARSVLREGKTPFYSHAVENFGSSRVAYKLNLVHVYDETVLEKAP